MEKPPLEPQKLKHLEDSYTYSMPRSVLNIFYGFLCSWGLVSKNGLFIESTKIFVIFMMTWSDDIQRFVTVQFAQGVIQRGDPGFLLVPRFGYQGFRFHQVLWFPYDAVKHSLSKQYNQYCMCMLRCISDCAKHWPPSFQLKPNSSVHLHFMTVSCPVWKCSCTLSLQLSSLALPPSKWIGVKREEFVKQRKLALKVIYT